MDIVHKSQVSQMFTNRKWYMFRVAVCVVAAAAGFAALAAKPVVTVTASLADGSTVKGDFLTEKIAGATLFEKNLALAPSLVRSINFTGTNGEAKVELSNGDRFAMTVSNNAFAVRSLLGNLKIPCASFRSLTLASRSAAAKGGSSDGLIFHCTFDNEQAIMSPAIGSAGKFMAGGFYEGKKGRALMTVPYTNHAVFEFPVGFLKDSGCIEFWAKILKQTPSVGDGGDPRLLAITSADTHDFSCNIDVVSNDGSGNSGFALRTWYGGKSSINGMRHLRYDDLFCPKNWRDWHHYAVVWNKDGISDIPNSPKAALLIDGKLIVSTGGGSAPVNMARMPSQMSHVLGITSDPAIGPEYNTKSPFLIDELKIWDYAKTDFPTSTNAH